MSSRLPLLTDPEFLARLKIALPQAAFDVLAQAQAQAAAGFANDAARAVAAKRARYAEMVLSQPDAFATRLRPAVLALVTDAQASALPSASDQVGAIASFLVASWDRLSLSFLP
jgi:hypothetical protein